MTLASFILKFFRLQRWTILLLFLLSLTWAIDSTVLPYILRFLVDTFTLYETNRLEAWEPLKRILTILFCFWVVIETGYRLRGFVQARALPKLEADIRMAMFDHILKHSPKYFNEHFAGSLANKISDMTTHVTVMLQNVMMFIPAIASSFLVLIFFFNVEPLFATILAVWIVLHCLICYFFTARCVAYSNDHGEARSKLAGKIVDSFTNNFAINLFFRYQFEKLRIEESQKIEREKNYRAQSWVAWMQLGLTSLFLIGMTTLIVFLIYFWIHDKISTGKVVQVINTSLNVSVILWVTGEILPQFYKSIGIAKQALTVMNDPQDVVDLPGSVPLVVGKGEIIFENVSFHYGTRNMFHNKDVHIRGGEKVGLVGYSGAGKSTFVNLILRFYPVDHGRILIDGQDIAHVTLESLHRQVSLIPQDPILFHRTLEDNIRYGKIDATEDQIVNAAIKAHCDEFIRKCPHGYKTLVGERGTKLSGGERQRIAIARAILAASPILILDEATSSLDSVTEDYIQESLAELMENRTTIVIAHRLSTLAKMDRILVFDKGKIVEQGTHEMLMSQKGHYAHMWEMQAGGFLPETPEDFAG